MKRTLTQKGNILFMDWCAFFGRSVAPHSELCEIICLWIGARLLFEVFAPHSGSAVRWGVGQINPYPKRGHRPANLKVPSQLGQALGQARWE